MFRETKKIPRGKVVTYKIIAKAIGTPAGARAVGNALNANRSKDVPCHRVVLSNGRVGGYAKGTKKKERILKGEGIKIKKGMINLDIYCFYYK